MEASARPVGCPASGAYNGRCVLSARNRHVFERFFPPHLCEVPLLVAFAGTLSALSSRFRSSSESAGAGASEGRFSREP
jgi:hypothetical protein